MLRLRSRQPSRGRAIIVLIFVLLWIIGKIAGGCIGLE